MIPVVGDAIQDVYLWHNTVRVTDEGPVARRVQSTERPGGSSAVMRMIEAMGQPSLLITSAVVSRKTRYMLDGNMVFRSDDDASTPPIDAIDIVDRLLPKCAICVLSDYGKGMVTRAVVKLAVDRCEQVICDPYLGVEPSVYAGASVICPNEPTFMRHRNDWDPFSMVVIKRGDKGCSYRTSGGWIDVGPVQVACCDTCGAGDQFIATLAAFLSRGMPFGGAVQLANCAAALNCTRSGTTPVPIAELIAFTSPTAIAPTVPQVAHPPRT